VGEMLHEILWQQNVASGRSVFASPFRFEGLADGTLDPEAFRRYVAQDAFSSTRSLGPTHSLPPAAQGRGDAHLALRTVEWGLAGTFSYTAGYAKRAQELNWLAVQTVSGR